MKANSYIKFTNIFNLIQLHFDSLDLPKIGMPGSIFTHTPHPRVVTELRLDDATVILSDSAKPTLLGETHAEGTSARFHPLRERGNTGNRQLQKSQLARRHHSLKWRWQSRLMQWL